MRHCYPENALGASVEEGVASGARGATGGDHVVNQDDVATG